MIAVGLRQLKNQLNRCLRRVCAVEQLAVAERGRVVAVISSPVAPAPGRLERLLRGGTVRWGGGTPRGARRPPQITGPTVARAVIDDRR